MKTELLEQIVKKQDEIIKFYGEIIDGNAMFLHIHHMDSSKEEIEKGIKLRSELSALKSQLKKEP